MAPKSKLIERKSWGEIRLVSSVKPRGKMILKQYHKASEDFWEEMALLKRLRQKNGTCVKRLTCLLKNSGHDLYIPFVQGQDMFYWMEHFYQPQTLQKLVSDVDMRRTSIWVLKLMLELAYGVEELHRHHIIHHDLKPENVMIHYDPETQKHWNQLTTSPPQITIVDLGLSCIMPGKSLRPHEEACHPSDRGTKGYRPPEVRKPSKSKSFPPAYYRAIDVFSLGVTFHELVFVERPKRYKLTDYSGSDTLDELLEAMMSPHNSERPTLPTIQRQLKKVIQEAPTLAFVLDA